MIIGVAVKFGDFVEVRMPAPNRHCHCFWKMAEITGWETPPAGMKSGGENQGFYTHTGKYLNRKQALAYVKRIKQPVIGKPKSHLFSEDVW